MSKKEVFIFEVSKQNFDATIIQNSGKLPVFVEFMGTWSGPCIQMADEISSLAQEFLGQFIFAKVDIDEQPELMKQYDIENIPTLKVFVNGEVALTEEGLLKESDLRAALKSFDIFSQSDETRQQARKKHIDGDTLGAIQLLTRAIQQDPSNVKVAMDMVQIFIDLGELEQSKGLYNQLPDSAKNSEMGKSLLGQLSFLNLAEKTPGKSQLQQQLIENPTDCDTHFDLAICLVAERNYEQAVNHLFEIMKVDPDYKETAGREMVINISNMLTSNNPELSAEFRRKLGAIS